MKTIAEWWDEQRKRGWPNLQHPKEVFRLDDTEDTVDGWTRYTPEEIHEMNVTVIGPPDVPPEEIAEATRAVRALRREAADYADYGPDDLHEKSMATGIEVMSNYVKGVAEEGRKLLSVENKERHPMSQRFVEVVEEMVALHDKKQSDYGRDTDPFANVRGSTEWDMPAWVGAMVRAQDKIRRLQQYNKKGTLANEGARDAFMDLAVYAVIALCLWEEEVGE